ncbi:MAG: DUF3553 domain-containing protein [Planctomycetes bacterium]|nr:DUF3553 domain-containing protein [Planctomycetota bacterium]
MSEFQIAPESVGQQVCNAARPEWGIGEILRVEQTQVGGRPAQRVSIQFATGHRTLIVPPARLCAPQPEPQREQGWLDTLGKRTPDDRLRSLPASVTDVLGTPRQRIAAVLPLYLYREDASSLAKWARAQTQTADPLTHWSRDELLAAFRDFCQERDAYLRMLMATLWQAEGAEAIDEVLEGLSDAANAQVRAALARPI